MLAGILSEAPLLEALSNKTVQTRCQANEYQSRGYERKARLKEFSLEFVHGPNHTRIRWVVRQGNAQKFRQTALRQHERSPYQELGSVLKPEEDLAVLAHGAWGSGKR
jgi:hypothetical protein